jgi:uncharacterized protein with PQ loop repeat
MEKYTQWVGIGAGICTGISLLPQLLKIIKEKKADAISWGMLAILLAGLAGLDLVWPAASRLTHHTHQLLFYSHQYTDHHFFNSLPKEKLTG